MRRLMTDPATRTVVDRPRASRQPPAVKVPPQRTLLQTKQHHQPLKLPDRSRIRPRHRRARTTITPQPIRAAKRIRQLRKPLSKLNQHLHPRLNNTIALPRFGRASGGRRQDPSTNHRTTQRHHNHHDSSPGAKPASGSNNSRSRRSAKSSSACSFNARLAHRLNGKPRRPATDFHTAYSDA